MQQASNSDLEVVVIGSALVELTPEQVGRSLEDAECFIPTPAGSAANFAVALAALGARVGLVSRVGQDELGRWLRAEIEALPTKKIREVRGLGLMVGIELRGKVTPVLQQLMERGVWALPAGLNVLRLLPPLVIEQEDLQRVVSVIGEALG